MRYENTTLEDQILDLGTGVINTEGCTIVYVQVVRCQLNLLYPQSIYIGDSTLTDSAIHAEREVSQFYLPNVFFRRCRFTGKYSDMRFGLTSNDSELCKQPGGLEDCDFSQAQLHLCTFHNCDPARIKFPGWPHITVLRPRQNADDWLAIALPISFRSMQETVAMQQTAVAMTIHWTTFAKKRKDTTDPESIRKLLEGKDYIVM